MGPCRRPSRCSGLGPVRSPGGGEAELVHGAGAALAKSLYFGSTVPRAWPSRFHGSCQKEVNKQLDFPRGGLSTCTENVNNSRGQQLVDKNDWKDHEQ